MYLQHKITFYCYEINKCRSTLFLDKKRRWFKFRHNRLFCLITSFLAIWRCPRSIACDKKL